MSSATRLDARGARLRRRRRLRAEARPPPPAAGAEARLAGACSRSERAERSEQGPVPRRGRCPACCRPAAYRFANAPHDSGSRRSLSRSAAYRFTRYRKQDDKELQLELPGNVDGDDLSRIVEGVCLARDLINTPANDMGPAELEEAARTLAQRHGAEHARDRRRRPSQAELSAHSCGRSRRRPRAAPDRHHLGRSSHPKVTLVGKGVCFDTGGLDIKPESGMLNMKKDMGGAASMLALAHMLMDRGTKIAAARAHPGGRERDLRRRPSARATSIARARASPSRSATPMPKAA